MRQAFVKESWIDIVVVKESWIDLVCSTVAVKESWIVVVKESWIVVVKESWIDLVCSTKFAGARQAFVKESCRTHK